MDWTNFTIAAATGAVALTSWAVAHKVTNSIFPETKFIAFILNVVFTLFVLFLYVVVVKAVAPTYLSAQTTIVLGGTSPAASVAKGSTTATVSSTTATAANSETVSSTTSSTPSGAVGTDGSASTGATTGDAAN
jgi:hypothetical protein